MLVPPYDGRWESRVTATVRPRKWTKSIRTAASDVRTNISGRITLALHRSNSAVGVGRLPSALYRPTPPAPLPGERVVIRS